MNDPPNTTQTIYSHGIYHGLPSLNHAPKGLTAVVTGANGISGAHMIRVLAQNPSRWTKIYALSRRPPSGQWPDNVTHIPLDFLSTPDEIAQILRSHDIKPDYIFWFSYILVTDPSGALQWSDPRLISQNNLILTNFLSALPLASALPKRITIQYGGKWYGVHLGATQVPCTEDQPPLPGEEDKNLYYTQHTILSEFCTSHRTTTWTAGLPPPVIGCTPDSSQTLLYPLLAFACVQKSRNLPLNFPGDIAAWWCPQSMGSAMLNSYQYEWMALSPNTGNEMFNLSDDCIFTWGLFWPQLAKRFGMEWRGPREEESGPEWKAVAMPAEPPPHGLGPRTVRRSTFSFVEWAKQSENQSAWKKLAERHGLRDGEWRDIGSIFGRADVCTTGPDTKVYSTTKAKQHGWFGFVDSYESMLSVTDEFVAMEFIPDPNDIKPVAT